MKRFIPVLIFQVCTLVSQAQQQFYDVTYGNGNGIRFWQSNEYKIHMGNSSEYLFGPVSDYSIKMNMSADAGRGWTWGQPGLAPIAALNNTGQMRIAGMFDAGGGDPMALRLRAGNYTSFAKSQINFSYAGGTGYSHSIRTRHHSSIPVANAIDFYLWQPGEASENQGSMHVMSLAGGKVGIGTTSPANMLDVVGPEGDFKARFQGPDGYITIGPANSGWAHIYTDRPAFIFNQGVYSFPGVFSSFSTSDLSLQTHGTTRMTIRNATGNVGIGTTSPDQKLTVKGKVHAEEVIIDLSVPAPDYVFEKSYDLKPLDEVKKFIDENKHLPEVPSAKEMEKDGVKVGEMEMVLLKKVEELTLYAIKSDKEMAAMRENYKRLEAQYLSVLKEIETIKNK